MCNPFTLNSKCNRPYGHRIRPVNMNPDDSLLHRLLSTDVGDFMSTIATEAVAAIEFPLPTSPFSASKAASPLKGALVQHTHRLYKCIPRYPLFYSNTTHLTLYGCNGCYITVNGRYLTVNRCYTINESYKLKSLGLFRRVNGGAITSISLSISLKNNCRTFIALTP